MIELNVTLWIQLANFFITLVVLNYLLIRPVRDMIRQRREHFAALTGEIDALAGKAKTELDHYEAALRQARDEAAALRKAAKSEAEAQEREILTGASEEAKGSLRAAQAEVRAEAERAGQELRKRVGEFAETALSKVLA